VAQLAPRPEKVPSILTRRCRCRGVVYVEFLIAFIPLFLLFLGTCQLILLTAARVVVCHAAVTATRSAIVVLEDTADDYGGAPRGDLSRGKSASFDWNALLGRLGVANNGANSYFPSSSRDTSKTAVQHGARMAAIRLAATTPLLTLAPRMDSIGSNDTLERSLVSDSGAQLAYAYGYTEAAAAVVVKSSESSDALAYDPIDPRGSVTVEVTYLYHCGVPVVRGLICRSLSYLLDSHADGADTKNAERLSQFANPRVVTALASSSGRYTILTGQATLTNQGANYLSAENSP
jgi:hypothetical protein